MPAFFNDIAKIWLLNIAIVLPAYAAFAFSVWLVLWVLLRRPLARRKIRADAPPYRQLVTEFGYSVRSVMIFATISVAGGLLIRGGFYPLSDRAGNWGPVWFWLSLALMIVGQDAYIYWIHRWMHRSRWYSRLHRRHHRSHNPSPFTAYSFDIGEALLMTAFPVLWPLMIPTPWATSLLFLMHQIFRNTLLHSGYELMPARADGRPWFDWMTTTTHHDLHHAQPRYNFASWFTWWDRWMKTEHPQYRLHFAGAARSRRSGAASEA